MLAKYAAERDRNAYMGNCPAICSVAKFHVASLFWPHDRCMRLNLGIVMYSLF